VHRQVRRSVRKMRKCCIGDEAASRPEKEAGAKVMIAGRIVSTIRPARNVDCHRRVPTTAVYEYVKVVIPLGMNFSVASADNKTELRASAPKPDF